MSNNARLVSLVALGIALGSMLPVSGQVVPPARRTAALESAEQLLAQRDASLPAKVADPFHPPGFGGAAEAAPDQTDSGATQPDPGPRTGPRTDRELVAAIAAAIKPSGYFILGGEPTLVFGQKRVKAGEPLTINFEGADYTLTITSIDRTSFTLRLNREEYTRPIK